MDLSTPEPVQLAEIVKRNQLNTAEKESFYQRFGFMPGELPQRPTYTFCSNTVLFNHVSFKLLLGIMFNLFMSLTV